MATQTFLKTSNNNNPLTSHQLLLRCSQFKSFVTYTLYKTEFLNIIASRAREHIKDDHDVNTNIFEKRQPQTPASVCV